MIVSEKSYQNLPEYIQFSFKKRFELNQKRLFLEKKSGNYNYDYTHSFFGKDF